MKLIHRAACLLESAFVISAYVCGGSCESCYNERMRVLSKTVCVAVILAGVALPAWAPVPSNQTCIKYTDVGGSDCRGGVHGLPQTVGDDQNVLLPPASLENRYTTPSPVTLSPPQQGGQNLLPPVPALSSGGGLPQSEVDQKVQDFLDNHGKPPREYVEFMVNPTLENAMRWAQKYKEDNTRREAIVRAWQQAEQILSAAQQRGVQVPDFTKDEAPVPDFANIVNAIQGGQSAGAGVSGPNGGAIDGQGGVSLNAKTLGDGGSLTADAWKKAEDVQSAPFQPIGQGGPIKISYYFSAQCPYCKRFEPEFQQVIAELGDRLEVTCVDMTPSSKQASNIFGKVDCRWRPLMPGEMKAFDIKSTPTLLIDRGANRPLQRLAGLVEGAKLKAFLTSGI